jgi:hypothetical protein
MGLPGSQGSRKAIQSALSPLYQIVGPQRGPTQGIQFASYLLRKVVGSLKRTDPSKPVDFHKGNRSLRTPYRNPVCLRQTQQTRAK